MAAGAQGLAALALAAFGAQGFMALPAFGAQGFADWARAGSGVAATTPSAAIDPRVCKDFLRTDMFIFLLLWMVGAFHNRVVTVTSQSGMARVREASTILSRPVKTKAPMLTKAAPIRGFPTRDMRASQSRREKIACRDP